MQRGRGAAAGLVGDPPPGGRVHNPKHPCRRERPSQGADEAGLPASTRRRRCCTGRCWRRCRKRARAPQHTDTPKQPGDHAASLGNHSEAEELPRGAKATRKRLFGLDYVRVLQTAVGLGDVLRKLGKYVGAAAACRFTLAALQCVLGPGHPDTLRTTDSLRGLSSRVGTPRRIRAGFQCL